MARNTKTDDRYIIPGLVRGLRLLCAFSREKPELNLTKLAAAVGLSRAATYRLVYTLEREGYLIRDGASKQYRLSPRVLNLGFEYLHSQDITKLAEPHLRALSHAAQANAHLGILDGAEVVYLLRVVARTRLVSNIQVGTRLPAHATSMGRVLLAGMPDESLENIFEALQTVKSSFAPPGSLKSLKTIVAADRERGFVVTESTFDPGVLSIAAGVRNQQGAFVAAINIAGPEATLRKIGGDARLFAMVRTAAAALSKELGFMDRRTATASAVRR